MFVNDDDDAVRKQCVKILGKLPSLDFDERLPNPLAEGFKASDNEMRGHYEMALGKHGMKLEALLDDNDPKIRLAAANSFGKLDPADLTLHGPKLPKCS